VAAGIRWHAPRTWSLAGRDRAGRPAGRTLALLALLAHLLIGLAPLWVPAAEQGGIEICTVDGLRVVPGPLPGAPDPGDPSGGDDVGKACDFCLVHGAPVVAALALAPLPPAAGPTATPAMPEAAAPIAGPAGFDHRSRAPPPLS
jgi:hypothetical protein